jgi:hypothetical protein
MLTVYFGRSPRHCDIVADGEKQRNRFHDPAGRSFFGSLLAMAS